MLFLLAQICFRVNLPEQSRSLSFKKPNRIDQNIDLYKKSRHLKEEGNTEDNFRGVVLENSDYNNQNTNKGQYTFSLENVNVLISNCRFKGCDFSKTMIYSSNLGYNLSMISNTITNCYNKQQPISDSSNLIYSKASYTNIVNNSITFSSIDNSCRASIIEKTTDTIFIDNQIKNANVGTNLNSKASCILFNDGGQGQSLVFSGNTFSSCYGGNGALFSVDNFDYHLHLFDSVFEYSKNNEIKNDKKEPSGYYFLMNIKPYTEDPQLSFHNCTFDHLESNAKGGGSIGLWFKENVKMKMTLTIENSKFTNLYFADNTQHGAVLLFHHGTTNKNTKLTVSGCKFKNISCADDGSAIHFESLLPISVENTEFNDVISPSDSQTKCAIYIKFYDASTEALIDNCQFSSTISSSSDQSNVITLESNSNNYQNKCTINKCTFKGFIHDGYIVFSDISEISFTYCEINSGCGGVSINPVSKFDIQNSLFKKTKNNPAIYIIQNNYVNKEATISGCIFDGCSNSVDGNCFYLELKVSSFIFTNNVIHNLAMTNNKYFTGQINCFKYIETLEMNNITFSNVKCTYLYGGGTGLMIQGVSKVAYVKCNFIGNLTRFHKKPSDCNF